MKRIMLSRLQEHKFLFHLLMVASIIGGALLIYGPLFTTAPHQTLYPWGSDTLGHVYRFEYFENAIKNGVFYPDFFPDWYLGIQLQRYYPPLPYSLLIILKFLSGDAILAVNLFIILSALTGGLSVLLYQRWLPWPFTVAGGLLTLALPDHLRVAFSEGNLPRVLANACLPVLIYILIRVLESGPGRLRILGMAGLMGFIVLCHPMMAAIFAVACGVLTLASWLARFTDFKTSAHALGAVATGLLLPAWWLIPSLTGGITELNSSAVTRGLDIIPWSTLINPILRRGNPEIIYLGITLLILSVPLLLINKTRSKECFALLSTGLFGTIIITPGFNNLFSALPISSLLWPIRFLGVASFLLLLAILWGISKIPARFAWVSASVFLLIGLDFSGSLHLIHMRPLRPEIQTVSEKMRSLTGWREATLDFSRLGSAPSYFFSVEGNREQVFGWAYQGARTASNVASINEALRLGEQPYLLDRLNLFGVDDVVLSKEEVDLDLVRDTLQAGGHQEILDGDDIAYFNRPGAPRAIRNEWQVLGIGPGAQNFAFLFPQVILGNSRYLDDYDAAELSRYRKIILSGFSWHDRAVAEDLVNKLASSGVQIFIDLTGTPMEPLARIPRFLDIWAEPVILAPEPFTVKIEGRTEVIGPFGTTDELWYTQVPQGLPTETAVFDHLGETAAVAGYIQTAGEPIWFIGINLAYQAVLADDTGSLEILAEILDLSARTHRPHQTVPLNDFRAHKWMYDEKSLSGMTFQSTWMSPERCCCPLPTTTVRSY